MSTARDALFDLAVNRAARVADRLGHGTDDASLRTALEVWYLRTRFAYRVPFEAVVHAVCCRPLARAHWSGGPSGGWHPGPPPGP
jgi:hypothetical protein